MEPTEKQWHHGCDGPTRSTPEKSILPILFNFDMKLEMCTSAKYVHQRNTGQCVCDGGGGC